MTTTEGRSSQMAGALATPHGIQAHLQALAHASTDGMVTVDGTGTMLFVNRAANTCFGYAAEELVGRCVCLLAAVPQGGPDHAHSGGCLGAWEPTAGAGPQVVLGRRKNGSMVPLSLVVCPFQVDGVRCFACSIRDLSAERRTEDALVTAMLAAESANLAKSEFLAMVSHEMRTPMNAILGMSELALASRSTVEQHEFIQRVQVNAEALLHLINGMLDLSKIEAHQLDILPEPVDVAALMEEVADELHVRASAAGLETVCDVDPKLPARLVVDPNRLRQILVNLLGNAVKFTERGRVLLQVEVGTARTDGLLPVTFRVEDTGIGIGPADQARVFERFFQADTSTTRRVGGTGLGLTITRSLVEKMGGTMTLQSKKGVGSTFEVRLLLPAVATDPLHHSVVAGSAGTVLLVDGHELSRDSAARALRHAGYSVEVLGDVSAALKRLQEDPRVQLLLVDQRLPKDGARRMVDAWHARALAPGERVALLVDYGEETLPVRVDGRLVRPLGGPRLVVGVQRVMRRQVEDVAHARAEVPAGSVGGRNARILLAEDNADNRAIAKQVLLHAGYGVDAVDNGEQAVARATTQPYDLILMDVEMPHMDGFQATELIRLEETQRRLERVPIVALTAHALEGFRQRCLDQGMDDYVAKPAGRQKILSVAEKWIAQRPLVLVVDDSWDSRILLRSILLHDGRFRMALASDGQEALEIAACRRVSAVLLDMNMPVLDGYATAQALRRTEDGHLLAIIALTGMEGAREEQRCRDAGCSEFLTKPVRRRDLLQALEGVTRTPPLSHRSPAGARGSVGAP